MPPRMTNLPPLQSRQPAMHISRLQSVAITAWVVLVTSADLKQIVPYVHWYGTIALVLSDSCGPFASCALHGASPDACVGRGKQGIISFCDVDGRALTCWHDQTLAVRDCPRGGEQCLVQSGQATCSLGSCPTTIVEGDKPRCSGSGTHLLHCEKGKLASLDCAAFGQIGRAS